VKSRSLASGTRRGKTTQGSRGAAGRGITVGVRVFQRVNLNEGRPASLVGGAASGTGRHMARVLHRAGHRLVLIDLDADGLERLVDSQGWQSDDAVRRERHDVRDAAGWEGIVERACQEWGRIDYMLNIAGYLRPGYVGEVDVSVPLPVENLSLTAHAGYNFGDFWDGVEGEPSSDYIDWSVGVGYTVGHFDLGLKWVDTTLEEGDFWFSDQDVNNTEGRVIFTIATTFPWSNE
jgi:NAD(P)-dependent dehydrogenase (short-subunit alcohol dehydrogenase family)